MKSWTSTPPPPPPHPTFINNFHNSKIIYRMRLKTSQFWSARNHECKTLYPRSKFEFEQDLPAR